MVPKGASRAVLRASRFQSSFPKNPLLSESYRSTPTQQLDTTDFQCTLDDLFDRTTKVTFDLPVAFPDKEVLSSTMLALLAASNDVTFLQRLWMRYENESGEGVAGEVRNSEKNFIFFLAVGFLREGMSAFIRLLGDKAASQLIKKLDANSKRSFEALKKESNGEGSLHRMILGNLRNDAIFHYNQMPYLQALQTIKQDKGHFVIGRASAETRFLIADDVRSEIFRSSINFDVDNEHEQGKVRAIITAMGHLTTFSSGFLIVYLNVTGQRNSSTS